jgi:hypothetical protein
MSAYRFVNGVISPIINAQEIAEIGEAINNEPFTAYKLVNMHLKNALEKFSDRTKPDYRNSIKESISAVEALVKILTNEEASTLGYALKALKSQINIHTALEQGFTKIYGYTSDADGIRHALTQESNCSFEDAKYMLVSCSAFINYLIAKVDKVKA